MCACWKHFLKKEFLHERSANAFSVSLDFYPSQLGIPKTYRERAMLPVIRRQRQLQFSIPIDCSVIGLLRCIHKNCQARGCNKHSVVNYPRATISYPAAFCLHSAFRSTRSTSLHPIHDHFSQRLIGLRSSEQATSSTHHETHQRCLPVGRLLI